MAEEEVKVVLAEIFALRKFKREEREGIPHYVTGQHKARAVGKKHAQLSYVDIGGHVCIMPCQLTKEGDWRPMGIVLRLGANGLTSYSRLPPGFNLSQNMINALKEAMS